MELYCIAPEGEWIVDHSGSLPDSPETPLPDAPFYFLLADDQDRVNSEGIERYRRTLEHVLDASRLEDASLIVHELDSSNEQLIIHRLDIIRDGRYQNALDPDNISVLQREAELERHITNRRFTVSLSIDDLRVGDIIDYAATIKTLCSDHPLQGRHYRSRVLLSWGCPVRLQTIRLINDGEAALRVQDCRYRDGVFSRQDELIAPGGRFEMKLNDPPLARIDDAAPNWFWPDHLWAATDARWDELSAYLHSTYRQHDVLREDIDLDADIIGDSEDLQQCILAAIDFVQNEIRYKGEHHGMFSHLPRSAADVLKKRSGDCKDKSNLLRAILTRLGVPASLVLVDTRRGHVLPTVPPSLFHFDHMIVRLNWQGRDYFIDATIKKQAGDLDHRAMLDHAHGLPLTELGEGLCPIPWDLSRDVYLLLHRYDFTSSDESLYSLEVLREYRYHRADNMRYHFQSNSRNKLEQDFLGYALSDTDLELKVLEPIHVIEDDVENNRLLTRERYGILSGPRNGEKQANIFTEFVNEFIQPPQVSHPVRIDLEGGLRHDVEVLYREGYDVSEEKKIDSPWFSYADRVWRDENRIRFSSTLKPLRRQVDEAEFMAFSKTLEDMRSRAANRFEFGNPEVQEKGGFWHRFFTDWTNYAMALAVLIWLWTYFN